MSNGEENGNYGSLTIEDILALKEDCDIEFKKALGRDGNGDIPQDFWSTYSAFANTDGGKIFLGLAEKHDGSLDWVGLAHSGRVKKNLFDQLNNRQKVSANLLGSHSIREHVYGGKLVLEISIPRASRKVRPVFVGSNPFGGTFIRHHEGDYRADDASVRRMLAEQGDQSCDSRILPKFGMTDLSLETLQAYIRIFTALSPTHPFSGQEVADFLRSINAWRKDRDTGQDGLTLAGLLMFGKQNSISEELPNYFLDYQERSVENSDRRWEDRVFTDGSWSGNLFDFYRRVYPKLTSDLKVPFQLEGATRKDETPVHEALREALVNALIHADYSGGRVSVEVIKAPGLFRFRNPGRMRVPIERAFAGGDSDCRNRILQKMFRFIGAGEQAGSGVPKIFQSWKQQHWRLPIVEEILDPEQTFFELHTTSLLPQHAVDALNQKFGERFNHVTELEGAILVTAQVEGKTDHKRMKQISIEHPADISKAFRRLAREGFIRSRGGGGRGTYYEIVPDVMVNQLDSVSSTGFWGGTPQVSEGNSLVLSGSSTGLGRGTPQASEGNSLVLSGSSSSLAEPMGEAAIKERELRIARIAREKKRLDRNILEQVVLDLCALRPQTIDYLSKLLSRSPIFLRDSYITPLIKGKHLRLLYPDVPNHPNQAYLSVHSRVRDTSPLEGA